MLIFLIVIQVKFVFTINSLLKKFSKFVPCLKTITYLEKTFDHFRETAIC